MLPTYLLAMGIVALVILLMIVILIKLLFHYEEKAQSAYSILEERFAKGEISEDEFVKRKKALQ
ncbi:SHOCT domain-containing protein [Alkalihalobacillus oceani]|uniref:SHOCT domain-containing protein n=1 Tax=Halalkalibacter oceani TaxID=1653776 RepID=UPI00203AFDF8|nr:SHOCT domain-containing protein [Halalkalibacter oceani]MCM3763251.1 SHOCT domain-containing protein [Halalkalibacter oceani]